MNPKGGVVPPSRSLRPLPGIADDEWFRGLARRLRSATNGSAIKQVAVRTGHNPETTRRYLDHGRVCPRFLAAFAEAFDTSLEWLLFEQGPMRRRGRAEPRKPEVVVTTRLQMVNGRVVVRGTAAIIAKDGTERHARNLSGARGIGRR